MKNILRRVPKPFLVFGAALTVGTLAVIVVLALNKGTSGPPGTSGDDTATTDVVIAVPAVGAEQLAALPEANTNTTLTNASLDVAADQTTDGIVVHNATTIPVFDGPGGNPIAKLPATEINNPTWLPVIDAIPGWDQILLPSRPNGSTGWVDTSKVQTAHTAYVIRVHLDAKTIEIFRDGKSVGIWTVAVGATETPTPVGRTFLMASIKDPNQTYSPVILPLGTHSSTLDTYGGGPGTVAIHTWPTSDVYGKAISHGCVRVPPEALHTAETVPLGSLVYITHQ